MKKFITLLLAFTLATTSFAFPAQAGEAIAMNINKDDESYGISDKLYGLFIEDISYACDGGLVSNLVNNDSFEYQFNKTAGWTANGIELNTDDTSEPLNKSNPTYARITADGNGTLRNLGYTELYDYKTYDINEDKIILTAKSATSHCLLKIILRNGYDARPNYYVRHISPENPVPADATASLLIGDDALWLYHNRKKYDYFYYDLGREWKKMTGVGMVYATWVVNRDFVKQHHEETKMLYDRIYRGIQNGYAKKDEIIKSVLDDKPFTYDQVSVYLERIRWNLTDEYLEGLKLFYSMAHDMNLIDHRPEIEVADVYY